MERIGWESIYRDRNAVQTKPATSSLSFGSSTISNIATLSTGSLTMGEGSFTENNGQVNLIGLATILPEIPLPEPPAAHSMPAR